MEKNQHQTADDLGLVLYGSDRARKAAFFSSFLEGVEAYTTGNWVEMRGIGPEAIGFNLGAVWLTK